MNEGILRDAGIYVFVLAVLVSLVCWCWYAVHLVHTIIRSYPTLLELASLPHHHPHVQ